jgi:hypothetical protein
MRQVRADGCDWYPDCGCKSLGECQDTGPSTARKIAFWCGTVILIAAAVLVLLSMLPKAEAHDAPKGWSYPYACCSGYDCREVPADWIDADEKSDGYTVVITDEYLAGTDKRVRRSPDGEYHWCSVQGKNDGKTICLFVPARSF